MVGDWQLWRNREGAQFLYSAQIVPYRPGDERGAVLYSRWLGWLNWDE